jgi:hypothetical protein
VQVQLKQWSRCGLAGRGRGQQQQQQQQTLR